MGSKKSERSYFFQEHCQKNWVLQFLGYNLANLFLCSKTLKYAFHALLLQVWLLYMKGGCMKDVLVFVSARRQVLIKANGSFSFA